LKQNHKSFASRMFRNSKTPYTHSHSHTLKTLGKHSRNTPAAWGAYGNCAKHEGGMGLFIGQKEQRTSGQEADIQWFLPSGSIATSYVQVLSRGYLKSSVRLVVPCMSTCTVCRVYVQWSPPYIRTTDSSIRPPDLAYVRPKVQITPLVSLVTQSPN
jgi:hypothetical protein